MFVIPRIALDTVIDHVDFDLMMALETDVVPLRADWLQWFVDQLRDDYWAAGHWHHENFISPSCTLYRGSVLREMNQWCKDNKEPVMRWGENFEKEMTFPGTWEDWVAGAFAEKRGWPEGTKLKESPTGQCKGHGWYEPGQQLHHWAVEKGLPYCVCPTSTTHFPPSHLPLYTFYGMNKQDEAPVGLVLSQMNGMAYTVHFWGGTRALDIIKHEVTDQFVKGNMPFWLSREAKFWLECVPEDIQFQTIKLIREHGWHYHGWHTHEITDRDREAAEYVNSIYRKCGIAI